ncbi:hypothetical protein GCM10011507_30820 [Edaphobacter acidisoli]|uniref:Uncharacterized protein n=1 Tax=Edaphobacter acidisoli TaxID=2040573 RepID=A0A916RZY4_9BACT|nr:hypothetical protein GCM10011507_30820 [Edaphobacter acidisoli]
MACCDHDGEYKVEQRDRKDKEVHERVEAMMVFEVLFLGHRRSFPVQGVCGAVAGNQHSILLRAADLLKIMEMEAYS